MPDELKMIVTVAHPSLAKASYGEVKARQPLVPLCIEILEELIGILKDRGGNYADFEDNSRVFLEGMASQGIELPDGMTAVQFHGMSNIQTKLARFATGNRLHEDTFLDIANYAVLIAAIQRRDKGHHVFGPVPKTD